MVFPFARHVAERGHGHPKRFRFQNVELKTERVAIAYRLLFATPLSVRSLSKIAHIYRLIATGSKLFRCETDYTAGEVRRFAKRAKDAPQVPCESQASGNRRVSIRHIRSQPDNCWIRSGTRSDRRRSFRVMAFEVCHPRMMRRADGGRSGHRRPLRRGLAFQSTGQRRRQCEDPLAVHYRT